MGLGIYLEEAGNLAQARRSRQRRVQIVLAQALLLALFIGARGRAEGRAAKRSGQIEAWREMRGAKGGLDLNAADREGLESLPGIGPRQADRILAWRKSIGPFSRIDDLSRVPGIGKNRVDQLRDLLRTEGR